MRLLGLDFSIFRRYGLFRQVTSKVPLGNASKLVLCFAVWSVTFQVLWTALLSDSTGVSTLASVPINDRVNCSPGGEISEENCLKRGCIYESISEHGPPPCYIHPEIHRFQYNGPGQENARNGWTTMNKNRLNLRVVLNSNLSISGKSPVRALHVEFERYSTRVMGFKVCFCFYDALIFSIDISGCRE